ncbi:acyltransferase family protein [Sphingosinicella sp. BN140058]|uniref:acyltransferase family protein n=1 Tax=Sphingosinicella sp. BN140058 TaxID=1892855 RepID=UPI0010126E36|nr:acyltransferase family protein [Sphingosinicella sp. BN140058]QAY75112.1 acyltransferase [Sphingosinicella sp. BN140058]
MAEHAAGRGYRPDIDGLRALAVLPVVLYHAGLGFPGGFLGVDIFFVISGYLIIRILYEPMVAGRFSAADFFERRMRRLFPALFAMLLGATAWASWQLIAPDLAHYGASLVAAIAYVSNIYFYVTNTGYFVESALTKPLLHSWSLGVEEQFYLLAPLGLWLLVRFTPRRAHVPAIALLTLLSLLLCAWLSHRGSPAAFYLLPARAWQLGLGGALALAALPIGRRPGLAHGVAIAGLAAVIVALLSGSEGASAPVGHQALAAFGAAAILASGAQSHTAVHRLLAVRPLVFVGRISYSLYLWHWPVIVALSYGAAAPLAPGEAVGAVVLSMLLAAASWRWIEQPIRTRRRLAGRGRLFAAVALASLIGIALGAALIASKGLPQRHPQLARLLDAKRLQVPWRRCFRATPERARADALCPRGAPNVAPSFMLVGDSHAVSLGHGVFDAARRHGVAGVQFALSGFLPLPGRKPRYGPQPERLQHAFEDYLRRHPELHTVIVTGFWSRAATGRSYREPLNLYYDADYDGSGAAYNVVAFRNGLERLVTQFPERRFILLDDIPTGEALSPLHRARQIHARGAIAEAGLTRAEADAQRASYEPILEGVAAHHANVRYRPVMSALCGPKLCPSLDGRGRPLYHNGDHLSLYGPEPLAPALDRIFADWPKRPQAEAR